MDEKLKQIKDYLDNILRINLDFLDYVKIDSVDFTNIRDNVFKIKDILNELDNWYCLTCYIEKKEFVKNYKFPSFIETKITLCSSCMKKKECRKDD